MFFRFGDFVCLAWLGDDTLFSLMFLGLRRLFLLFFDLFEAIDDDRTWLLVAVPAVPWDFFVFLLKQKKSSSV